MVIVGATSAMAAEAARAYAEGGARLFLTGRNPERLAAIADDLRARGAGQVDTAVLDLLDIGSHEAVLERAIMALGELDVVLVAHGILPDQGGCETSVAQTLAAVDVNFRSTVAFLTPLANRLEMQRRGTLAVITSVAGDRGRQSNYVYGATKGGLGIFLQGLRNRLHRSGVVVLTLKPGFVDTPMTGQLAKNPLYASARSAGKAIHRAIEAGRDVAYIPWFWRPIMCVVNNLPEALFKRLRL